MSSYFKVVIVAGICAAFAVGGTMLMAPSQAATSLEDAASLSMDNEFSGVVNQFPSVKIGEQGVGGVTFFNGTIVNATTDNGDELPVTFGDDVRIDGRIWRGEEAGEDDMPVIIEDDLLIGEDMYFQPATTHSDPPDRDCNELSEIGRTIIVIQPDDSTELWTCRGEAGWFSAPY